MTDPAAEKRGEVEIAEEVRHIDPHVRRDGGESPIRGCFGGELTLGER